jgi:hypothetical protein
MELTGVFLVLILVAAIVEAIWETLKKLLAPVVQWLDARGFPADQAGALIVALLICFGLGSRVDLFVMLGISLEVAYLGIILTAVLLSRGSNFIHDLIGTLSGLRENNNLIDFEAGK